MKQNKMSSAKQTNRCAQKQAYRIRWRKSQKGMKENWKRKNGKEKNAMSL